MPSYQELVDTRAARREMLRRIYPNPADEDGISERLDIEEAAQYNKES